MYFPIRQSLPARPEPDNTFRTYSTYMSSPMTIQIFVLSFLGRQNSCPLGVSGTYVERILFFISCVGQHDTPQLSTNPLQGRYRQYASHGCTLVAYALVRRRSSPSHPVRVTTAHRVFRPTRDAFENGTRGCFISVVHITVIFKVAFSTFWFKFGATLRRQIERRDSGTRQKASNLVQPVS